MIMMVIFGILFFMIVGSYFTFNNRDATPIQDASRALNNRFCTACGDQLDFDTAYCSNCGIRIK